jgi:Type IV secretion system pilin
MDKKIASTIIFFSLFCLPCLVFGQSIQPPPGVPQNFTDLLNKIAGAVGTLIASLGVVMIIVAGIFYLTSAGSPERIGVAKKALIYAIAGIAIGLAAQAIVNIVLGII